jgi:hypothetical protein
MRLARLLICGVLLAGGTAVALLAQRNPNPGPPSRVFVTNSKDNEAVPTRLVNSTVSLTGTPTIALAPNTTVTVSNPASLNTATVSIPAS